MSIDAPVKVLLATESSHGACLSLRADEIRTAERTLAAVLVSDAIIVAWRCSSCAQESFAYAALPPPAYRNLDELLASARRTRDSVGNEAPRCACGGRRKCCRFDMHSFNSALEGDLVARVIAARISLFGARVELASCRGATFDDRFAPTNEIEARIAEDAAGRALWQSIRCAEEHVLEALVREASKHRIDVLAFAPELRACGHLRATRLAARCHVDAQPDDADGYIATAQAVYEMMRTSSDGAESLFVEGRDAATRAIALAPDEPGAVLALCNLLVQHGDAPAAAAMYLDALSRDDGIDAFWFNLGLVELAHDPASALERFRRGASKFPNDADFPHGEVRALLALGRPDDAKVALARVWATGGALCFSPETRDFAITVSRASSALVEVAIAKAPTTLSMSERGRIENAIIDAIRSFQLIAPAPLDQLYSVTLHVEGRVVTRSSVMASGTDEPAPMPGVLGTVGGSVRDLDLDVVDGTHELAVRVRIDPPVKSRP